MKAVVMAGGEGTRLRPITSNQPKPMVPIVNKPIIEFIIEHLKKHNIKDIVATLQYLPRVIKSYFADGEELGVNLSYAIEEAPLGTAGSVKNAEEYLDDTFVVISGDALTDINLAEVVNFHKKNKAMVTITLKRVENPLEFGIVITDKKGRVEKFLEKPSWGEVFSDTINTGIYILEPEVFKYIPKDKPFDFSKELFPFLLKSGFPIYGYIADGYWCDVGDIEQYVQAHRDILDGKVDINVPGIKMEDNIWINEGAVIDPDAEIQGPAIIGHDSKIEAGTVIGKYSVIGSNVIVRGNAKIHRTIIGENSYIGSNVTLYGSVVGKNCDIKNSAQLGQGVVLGDDCRVGDSAVINNNVKVYPFKVIDGGAIINRSIIWESKGTRTLFGRSGVSGIINIDVTPDMAARLAMAYGTSLKKGSHVAVSRDSNRASRMIKRAVVAGLGSAGIHCRDLRMAPTPINRFTIRATRCSGGIHIQVSPFDPQVIEISFFDTNGINLSEAEQRKIERGYYREDFRRAFHNEVGETSFPTLSYEYYADALLKKTANAEIRKKKFRIIVDYAYGNSALVLPQLIGKLGCEVISLNAYTDEDKSTITIREFEHNLEQLGRTVKTFKADFGVLIDSTCERLILVDDRGQRVSYDLLLLLFIDLIFRFGPKGKIAVPVTVPSAAETIAKKYGRKILRTKLSATDLMTTSLRKDVVFAGAQGGRLIFPRFLPAYDAMQSLCLLLECLAKAKSPISELVDKLPEFHLAQKNIFCAWENKGLVMRTLLEKTDETQVDLTDGIKIFKDNNWVLVIPDPEEPVCKVYSEANSDEEAQSQVDKFMDTISQIVSEE
ncbi:MAG TPA: mannose-1-phosphate guanyltransferase [Actinobacteria bacterium]|nr:mannose-1-phosphate guanyltransferase [Actinomycetota bacterium]